jgi:hypothetical protein
MATKDDNASIDVTKPKLEMFCGNDRDTLDIKTWCLQSPSIMSRPSPKVGQREHGDYCHGGAAGAGAQLGSSYPR